MANKKTRTDRVAVACINALFVTLILLLLFVFLFSLRPRILRADTPLFYTVRFNTLPREYVAEIHRGDSVLDAVGKRVIGEVVSFTVTPAMTEVYSKRDNCLRTVPYPNHVTLTLTVAAEARRTGQEYSIGGFSLYGGKSIPLRLPNFVGTGICTDIEVAE